MTDEEKRPRTDEEFVNHENIRFMGTTDWQEDTIIYSYGVTDAGNWVNVEFMHRGGDSLIDAYFYPEDLERLGIMFQYLGKTAREARDGTAG